MPSRSKLHETPHDPASAVRVVVAPAPAARAAIALQQSAGNHAVTAMLSAAAPRGVARSEAFEVARSSPPSAVPRRAEMEAAFGTGFGDVRAHLGGEAARAGLDALGARAAARGTDVVFREATPPPDLIAHELAHVVQQRRGTAGVACSASSRGTPSSAERAAEEAGAAVAQGRPVPDVGVADAGAVQLAPLPTSGGEWDTVLYNPFKAGNRIGADIDLTFLPTDPVVADNIGLTQTVRTLRNTAAGGAANDPSFVSTRNQALSLPAGGSDPGRAIDQGDPASGTLPNTNPLYAVDNSPGHVSATLTDTPAGGGFGTHGSRRRRPDGTFDAHEGHLRDHPRRNIEFAGQQWEHTFEATALVLDGPLANMYLGSVEWGWRCDAAGTVTVMPLRVVREGPPTASFMDAARLWNAATFTDPATGVAHPTVDLPIEAVDPGALSTTDLSARLAAARTDAAAAAGAARDRKNLEVRSLERELRKRNIKVAVRVVSTEDWTGPDDVYVRLSGGASHRTSAQRLNNGHSHDFLIPISAVTALPLAAPVQVEVFDEDAIDADDRIVNMTWNTPFGPTSNSSSMDGADYRVTVSYER